MSRYWEDYNVGNRFESPGRTVTEADISIVLGVSRYIEPFMVDEEFAKNTVFKGRVAPGRFTILMMGGLSGIMGWLDLENQIALLGLDQIRFKAPLRAGDTIRVVEEVMEKRETSKPDNGIIVHKESCINQKGEVLVEAMVTHLMKRRPKE